MIFCYSLVSSNSPEHGSLAWRTTPGRVQSGGGPSGCYLLIEIASGGRSSTARHNGPQLVGRLVNLSEEVQLLGPHILQVRRVGLGCVLGKES